METSLSVWEPPQAHGSVRDGGGASAGVRAWKPGKVVILHRYTDS